MACSWYGKSIILDKTMNELLTWVKQYIIIETPTISFIRHRYSAIYNIAIPDRPRPLGQVIGVRSMLGSFYYGIDECDEVSL